MASNHVAPDTDTERLAAYLRMLKERTGRSFDALGRRAAMSGSSLHRYCAGTTVPPDFAGLVGFAQACGATRDELRELRRLWVLAEASRDRGRTGQVPLTEEAPADRAREAADGGTADHSQQTSSSREESRKNPGAARRSRVPEQTLTVVGITLVLLGLTVGVARWVRGPDHRGVSPTTSTSDDRLLFSPACSETVSLGQNDECVREAQRLLKAAGGRLAVDGSFGPETLRRVTAFQVLAGLPPRGVVDEATKRALYDRKVTLETWSTGMVERRIREVFVEDPERAVAIADCQSYLDPHWLQPNPNGTRNWGVFQISDYRLTQFRATAAQALDPEWNIQAAYQLWRERPDFSDWPNCARAARIPQATPSSAGR